MTELTKVMIVEDNPHARRALTAVISQHKGITVIGEASNGVEAIEFIKTRAPDVVLMDLHMPRMGGLDATRIIKHTWPHIKIVVLTIYAECQSELLSAGADMFLVKGCSTDKVIASICELPQGT